MSDGEPRKLAELRVVDLRVELEKRGLEKTGVKAALMERLGKALRDEGHDPETYLFLERAKRNSTREDAESETSVSTNADEAETKNTDEVSKDTDTKDTKSEAADEKEKKEPVENDKKDDQNVNGAENEDSLHLTIEEDYQLLDETTAADEECSKPDIETKETTAASSEEQAQITEKDEEELAEETNVIDQIEVNQKSEAKSGEDNEINEEQKQDQSASHADEDGSAKVNDKGSTTDTSVTADTPSATQEKTEDGGTGSAPPTSETGAENFSSSSATTPKKNDKDAGRSLWISGLASKTRATDLKQLLSKYGKVVGAKVVANARSPSARCYGYVVMATVADAENCIKYCHRTEFHGRLISIDKSRQSERTRSRSERKSRSPRKDTKSEASKKEGEKTDEKKTDDKSKESDTKSDKDKSKDDKERHRSHDPRSTSRKRDREHSDRHRSRSERGAKSKSVNKDDKKDGDKDKHKRDDRSKDRRRSREGSPYSKGKDYRDSSHHKSRRSSSLGRRRRSADNRDVLSFRQIREERERQRMRQREREMREAEERRRREEQARVRELERRNKKEASRLERERERLRIERERLQREKAELIRMERKRIEQERIELQNLKMEESRRPSKRSSDDRRDSYPEDRKRLVLSSHRYDAADPVHFEVGSRSDSLSKKHDLYKADDYKSRDIDSKSRNVDRSRPDDYKSSRDIRLSREDMRSRDERISMRDDIRSRDDYSKRDRADFPPPPPRLSSGSSNVMSKYSNVNDSPPYVGSGRSSHEVLRREPMPPSVMSSVRTSGGIGKDMRYSDRVGPPGQSPEPGPNSYRGMHDDRRDHGDHRSGHGHRGYEIGSMKDYGDRDHPPSGWHSTSTPMKPFPSSVMGVNSNSDPSLSRGDPKKFEPWLKGDNPSMMWSGGGRMEPGPAPGRWTNSPLSRLIPGPPGDSFSGGDRHATAIVPPGTSYYPHKFKKY